MVVLATVHHTKQRPMSSVNTPSEAPPATPAPARSWEASRADAIAAGAERSKRPGAAGTRAAALGFFAGGCTTALVIAKVANMEGNDAGVTPVANANLVSQSA
jgi:hypothetical protein